MQIIQSLFTAGGKEIFFKKLCKILTQTVQPFTLIGTLTAAFAACIISDFFGDDDTAS